MATELKGVSIKFDADRGGEFKGFVIKFEPVKPSAFEGLVIKFENAEQPTGQKIMRRQGNIL